MEKVKSHQMTIRGESEAGIKVKVEVAEEEFYEAMGAINFVEVPAVKYEVQESSVESSECPEVILQSDNDAGSLLRCRLCAIPNNDMVDIFSSCQTQDNIVQKIKLCLRIVVKESDPLPKQVCWMCLEKLDFCYNFNEAVAEAENQLRDLCRQMSTVVEETQSNYRGRDMLKTCSDMEMQYESTSVPEEAQTGSVTVRSNPVSACTKPYSIVLVPNEASVRNEDGSFSSIINEHRVPRGRDTGPRTNKRVSNTRRRKVENPGLNAPADAEKRCYKCDSCAKTFNSKYYLARHYKIHTGEGLEGCQYCEKKFTSKTDRDRHQRIHTNERPFKCSVCEKTFISSSALKGHSATHSENRAYPCFWCDKSFKIAGIRNRHMSVHMDEKKWQCDHCKGYFKRRDQLQKHLSTCK